MTIKHKDKILAGIFLIWGMFIIINYLLSFLNYGDAFVQLLILFFSLVLLLLNFVVLFKIILLLFWPHKKIYDLIISCKNKILIKKKKLKIPVYYFPLSLYIFALLWIIWIYFDTSYKLTILGNNIITLLLASWIFLIGYSLGYKLLKIFKYKTEFFLEKFICSCALGFGFLMILMYFLGMFGLYYMGIVYALIIIITVITHKEIIELWNFIKNKNNYFKLDNLNKLETILLFLIPVILGIYIVGIFQQFPVGFDAQISYLSYPKSYAENHSIVNFPQWIYYGFPQNGEMLFTLGCLLYNFQISLGIIYIFTILIVLVILYFFKKNKIKGELYAVLFFLTLPPVSYQNIEDHKIEIIFTFYVILSYLLFVNYLKEKNKKTLIFFSIICGIAAGLKYFFLIWYIVPIVIIFIYKVSKKKLKVNHFFIWGVIIFILMLPWFLKNIKYSGNPIDPILSEKIAYKQDFYNSLGEGSQKYIVNEMRNEAYLIWDDESNKSLKFLINIPFQVSFINNKKYLSDSLNIGYLIILFIPIIFLKILKEIKNIKNKKIFFYFIFLLGLTYVGWIYVGHLIMWYALPLLVVFSILSSYLFIDKKNKYLNLLLKLFFILWIIVFINYQFSVRESRINSIIYSGELDKMNIYNISEYINKETGNSIVWGIDEVRNYYIDERETKFIPDNYLLAFSYLLKNKEEDKVLEYLKNNNINYFLWRGMYNSENLSERMLWAKMPNGSEEYANFTLDNYKRVIKFKNKHMELVAKEGEYYLYKLKEE